MPDAGDVVGDDEVVIRFVHKNHFSSLAPDGSRVGLANLPSQEFTPPGKSYPSVYRESRRSIEDLESDNPKWRDQAVVKVRVGDLRELGLDICSSPDDCNLPHARDAHASIHGVTKENRQTVIDLFGRRVFRPPR